MLTSKELYDCLETTFGPSEGWPGNTVTIMATAVLVQNTAWTAVVRAVARFPQELTAAYLLALPVEQLMDYIRPCGFMGRKAATIRAVMEWYGQYDFSESKAQTVPQERLRQELLAKVYADYHWLLLEHGKRYCKKRPLCEECPLRKACARKVQEEK